MDIKIPISRRDFMKLAGLTTAGAILNPSFEKVEAAEKIKIRGKRNSDFVRR